MREKRKMYVEEAVFYGIAIPFPGTSLGASCVFFMKKNMSEQLSRILNGFAAGVIKKQAFADDDE